MSDYQRIVSYLYEYHHGIKGANVGFAKIEKRQKQLRLYFHVKTNDKSLKYKIYFYRFRHGTMEGILLDSIQRSDTVIEFKNTYPLIAELDTIDGFLIYHSNDYFFGSQWKDHPIAIRNFSPLDQKLPEPEPIPEQTVQTAEPEETTSSDSEEISELPAEEAALPTEEAETSMEEPPMPQPDPSDATKLSADANSTQPLFSAEEASPSSPSKLAEYIEALQLEKCAKEKPCETPSADFDWKEYPSLLMPADYCFSPCIKIQLEDLEQIPDLPEHIKTNGFLLLNYGNYGHLMFAQNKKTKKFWLGVPGIFDNEKSFISKLFGFQSFLTVPVKSQKTGNFGYFILPI